MLQLNEGGYVSLAAVLVLQAKLQARAVFQPGLPCEVGEACFCEHRLEKRDGMNDKSVSLA